ncbi:imidazolonepropionase [Natrialbaceae archaeon A-chndr2]
MSAENGAGTAGHKTIVYNAGELAVGPEGSAGNDNLRVLTDGALVAVDGTVVSVGSSEEITRSYPPENADTVIDAAGDAVVPGFVDPHTHAVFAGDRSDEFEAKLEGTTYQELLADGGGILRTVRATREASLEELVANLRTHLDVMLAHGTTTAEVKSGYGLDTDTECRLLEAISIVDDSHPVDLVATFLGAHAVPPETDADAYVEQVIDEQLPAVANQGIARFCDVFCEDGVFSVEQSRRVLEAGLEFGLTPKVHAEELSHLGGTKLAADLEAASADHLLYSSEDDIDALVAANTVPVLLPGTAFGLGESYADARGMLEAGAPVALATDFNPNCFGRSMTFTQTLACVGMGMTPAEALLGSTTNAAMALDLPGETGRLEPGAPADFLVVDGPRYAHLAYQLDGNPVRTVCKDGRVVAEGGRRVDTDSDRFEAEGTR